jgi:arginase family enzyme
VTRRELIEAVSERHRKATEIHLDADVLDDAAMPAVDYRLPGGLLAIGKKSCSVLVKNDSMKKTPVKTVPL